MEDEDNENGLVDKYTLWEEAYYKQADIGTSLAQINNSNVSIDDIDETREDCFYSSYPQEPGGNGNSDASLKNVIKGFKKNILKTKSEENQADSFNDNVPAKQTAQTNDVSMEKTNEMGKAKEKNMAEYAQYLGLQPASLKSECRRCHTLKRKKFDTESNQDQCDCSAEQSSHADADSSKLSLVNNVEFPSTSSRKLSCTEQPQSSVLDDPELLTTNNCVVQQADATVSLPAGGNQSQIASLYMSPAVDTPKESCADESEMPDANGSNSPITDGSKSPDANESRFPDLIGSVSSVADGSKTPDTDDSESPNADDVASLEKPSDISQPLQTKLSMSSPTIVFEPPSEEVSQSPPANVQMDLPERALELATMGASRLPSKERSQSPSEQSLQSPSKERSQSPSEQSLQSPSKERSQSPSVQSLNSPSMEMTQSPPADVQMELSEGDLELAPTEAYRSPSKERSQSPSVQSLHSPSKERSQSPRADVQMELSEEDLELAPTEASRSPSKERSQLPSMQSLHSPSKERSQSPPADVQMELSEEDLELAPTEASRSPSVESLNSPSMEIIQSPSVEASQSPIGEGLQSPSVEVVPSPAGDRCMSPAAEASKSPLADVSKCSAVNTFESLPAEVLIPPLADASQSSISNNTEFLSTDSSKPAGSDSPESSCAQLSIVNISESISCKSSELPPAESSQSPPQTNMEISCDSDSKELQTDSSKVSTEEYEPVPSTSYQEPVPSTSGYRLPATKTLDSTKPSSGVQSTSQSSNSKATSKVYLCAACEKYFENWNLFTHMQEVHQRHICLFCLGMFGQAEKLSQHLLKKHNVPNMNFTSAEEFFKVIIGPCYVVCCGCDKMFTETDNLEHFCPPREAVQSTSGVCSQCKKIDSHTEGCTLAPEKSDSKTVLQSSPNSSRTTKGESTKTNQTVNNVIRHSKRTIKPNRLNDDIYLYTKLTNIRTKRTKLQSTSETSDSACSDTHKDTCATEYRNMNSFSNNTIKDVCTGADNENSFKNDRSAYTTLENHGSESEKEILSRVSAKDTYDNVTDTIMAVSQGTNSDDSTHVDKMPSSNLENTLDCSTSKGTVESSEPKDEDDVRLKKLHVMSDETKELDLESNTLHDTNENSDSDSESQASESCSSNPEDESFDNNDEVSTKKGQNKPVLTATPVTDRSLVIKICTKNNSVYSIKTPSHVESSHDNHDSSRESEENNNSEESDKAPAGEDSEKNLEESNPDGDEKMNVAESCENEKLGSIHFDLDVNKENKSDINNQLDKKSEENCNSDEKSILDVVSNKIENFDGIPLAGEEISVVDLEVDDLLEKMELENLLKRCIKAVCGTCVYCNHARHIAVNGKQLSLHMLSEHRFQPQHPAIIINQDQFTAKVKKCYNELESYYFNLDSYNTKQGTFNVSTVKTYECFHCRFYSNSHKELYLHNRKMHQKPILICIMCKSTFLSYSELLCHLCPGVYAANVDIHYRCCMCEVTNIPSTFRLMVHLRKLHHACDVCLETTTNQQSLSNHVWKHKLNHLCYRCGIAYRNKPDITKHLFWKHGTESVLCKKCLQKKWPYIYHFCVPPADFHCEECGFTCSKAVGLKVHKRIHTNEYPYSCSQCPEKLISKKLLAKHEHGHREPEPPPSITPQNSNENQASEEDVHVDVCDTEIKENEVIETVAEVTLKEPVKKVVDVLDLPPLNLSDSDSDDEETKPEECKSKEETEKIETDVVDEPEIVSSELPITTEQTNDAVTEVERNEKEKKQEEQIMDGIWDNFKSYTASLEKQESMEVDSEKPAEEDAQTKEDYENLKKAILADHDYCVVYPNKGEEGQSPSSTSKKTDDNVETDKTNLPVERTPSPTPASSKPQNNETESPKKKVKSPKKKKQNTSGTSSDSSSDSDSSNCSCGTGCSCSSSSSSGSSSSSSSSDSDSSSSNSPKKANREKRKKAKAAAKTEEKNEVIAEVPPEPEQGEPVDVQEEIEVVPVEPPKLIVPVLIIRESDLETTETDTDEEFYDQNPQQTASKLLAEKRQQTLHASGMPGLTDVAPAPVNGVIDTNATMQSIAAAPAVLPSQDNTPLVAGSKRKFKTRKRRKGLWGKARNPTKNVESIKLNIPKTSYQRRGAPRGRRHSTVSNVSSVSVYEANQASTPGSTSFARTQSLGGSGSELDTTRASKRRRVPKRFYDDSSDEENHMQRMLKWRRTDAPPVVNAPSPSSSKQNLQQQQQLLLQQQHQQQQLLIQQQQQLIMQQQQQQLIIQQQQQQLQYQQEQLLQAQRQQQQQIQQQNNEDDEDEEKNLVIAASDSDSNDSSSSDSSDSDNEQATVAKNQIPAEPAMQTVPPSSATLFHSNFPQMHPVIPERSSNLYCYCQCPYDEVSEMIACDGDECQIEWFHFECVGISVPPKGKWFCPDCRKNLGMSDEEMAIG